MTGKSISRSLITRSNLFLLFLSNSNAVCALFAVVTAHILPKSLSLYRARDSFIKDKIIMNTIKTRIIPKQNLEYISTPLKIRANNF